MALFRAGYVCSFELAMFAPPHLNTPIPKHPTSTPPPRMKTTPHLNLRVENHIKMAFYSNLLLFCVLCKNLRQFLRLSSELYGNFETSVRPNPFLNLNPNAKISLNSPPNIVCPFAPLQSPQRSPSIPLTPLNTPSPPEQPHTWTPHPHMNTPSSEHTPHLNTPQNPSLPPIEPTTSPA